MHTQIRQPGHGRCSITAEWSLCQRSVARWTLTSTRIASNRPSGDCGIKTDTVRRDAISDTISTVGAIAIDESRMATIPSYIDGRIERLFADYTGVDVKEGDHLAPSFIA